jgi:hypothetical protein
VQVLTSSTCCDVPCFGRMRACPWGAVNAGTSYRPCATCRDSQSVRRTLADPPTHPLTRAAAACHTPLLPCVLPPFPPQVSPWDVDTDVEERLRQEEEARKAAAAAAAAEELARQEAAAEAAREKRRQNQRARLGECGSKVDVGGSAVADMTCCQQLTCSTWVSVTLFPPVSHSSLTRPAPYSPLPQMRTRRPNRRSGCCCC